jgi:hypothetical protein
LANVITLGARDITTLRAFYQRLNWPIVHETEDFVVFELRGSVLALFPVDKLATDGNALPEGSQGGIRFTLGIVLEEARAVDEFAEVVRQAGGRFTKAPVDAEFFPGRSAYFADPEGNYWEIAWAPPDNPVVAAARRAARWSEA